MRRTRGIAAGAAAVSLLLGSCSSDKPNTGASQSAADAKRDGVVPALAALELKVRSDTEARVRTTEGTWVLSGPSDAFSAAADDGCVGSRKGRFAFDFVCVDYAEILLLDANGKIRRAYPMPEIHPGWIYATPEAVFAGRVADGCQPDSSLVRIDRKTLKHAVIVFPSGGDAKDRTLLPSWRLASETEAPLILQLVGASDGTEVTSAIGPLRVDIEGVARLFAAGTPAPPAPIPSGSC
jgi:hypothetical protein